MWHLGNRVSNTGKENTSSDSKRTRAMQPKEMVTTTDCGRVMESSIMDIFMGKKIQLMSLNT